jgi:serine/threonine protein kinase
MIVSPARPDARSDAKSDAKSSANSDVNSEIVGEERQVTYVRSKRSGKDTRGPFESMRVSIIEDRDNPFSKYLLLVDHTGYGNEVSLVGAEASLLGMETSHPDDVQPSFAGNSVYIRFPSCDVNLIVASPTVKSQRSFLDQLCHAGCIMPDLESHFTLLPKDEQPSGEARLRLGRPTVSRRRSTPKDIVALKCVSDEDGMSQLLAEVQILMNLHHDGIVKAYGIYSVKVAGKRSLSMLLDYKEGSDLNSWTPIGGLPEWMVRGIMAQICDALVYLHGIPVVHRDIKPTNVLCERAEDGSVKVVLADFGLAAQVTDMQRMSRRCGTGGFIAPEMYMESWTTEWSKETVTNITKIDVFSLGMLIYSTAFGDNPFYSTTLDSTYRRNARCLLSFSQMGGRSDALQSLLSGLCAKNPRERLSSSEALAHPWFSSKRGLAGSKDDQENTAVPWTVFVGAAHGFP